MLALTTTSPTMPDQDRLSALEMAKLIGARHVVIESNELEVPGYAQNPPSHGYFPGHGKLFYQANFGAIRHPA